jgi:hypothetical protein
VKADALSGRDDPAKYYHFLWWRLPKSLYWLGKPTAEHPDAHDSLWLRFWAGNSVAGESFLLGVAVAVAIVLVPYMF